MSIANIRPTDVAIAATKNDIGIAINTLQEIAGISYGDVAGVIFTGFDWLNAEPDERIDMIHAWMEAERAYEEAVDEDNAEDEERHRAYLEYAECRRNGHRDTGRGVCANCGDAL